MTLLFWPIWPHIWQPELTINSCRQLKTPTNFNHNYEVTILIMIHKLTIYPHNILYYAQTITRLYKISYSIMLDQSDHIFDTTNYGNKTMYICFCQNRPIMVKSIRRHMNWQRKMHRDKYALPTMKPLDWQTIDFIGFARPKARIYDGFTTDFVIMCHIMRNYGRTEDKSS